MGDKGKPPPCHSCTDGHLRQGGEKPPRCSRLHHSPTRQDLQPPPIPQPSEIHPPIISPGSAQNLRTSTPRLAFEACTVRPSPDSSPDAPNGARGPDRFLERPPSAPPPGLTLEKGI